jgi:hypothetical protein
MGSVIDYIECPNCEQEAFSDYYYKTGEQYTNCNSCGYHYSFIIKRDEEGKMIKKDESKDFAVDNVVREENELNNPYGAYRIKQYDSVATQCGTLTDKKHYDEFVSHVLSLPIEERDIEFCTISRFINGEIVIETLIGKPLYSWEYIDEESVYIYNISEDNENAYDSIEQIKEQLTKEGIINFKYN